MAIKIVKNNSSYPWAKDDGHFSTKIDTSSSKLSSIFIYEVNKEDKGFPGGSDGKESACNAGDLGSVPGLGRSPGGGHGNPLQYSCLENPMDGGVRWATIHGVAESDTTEMTCHTHSIQYTIGTVEYLSLCILDWPKSSFRFFCTILWITEQPFWAIQ